MTDKKTTAVPASLSPAFNTLINEVRDEADAGIAAEGLVSLGITVDPKTAF